MQQKIRDIDRRQIRDALEAVNDHDWKMCRSEIDYVRNQIFFWMLVNDPSNIAGASEKILRIIHPHAIRMPAVQFYASLIELTENEEINWEMLDHDDLRRSRLTRPPGSRPSRTAKPEFTVFDTPDYVIQASEEPI